MLFKIEEDANSFGTQKRIMVTDPPPMPVKPDFQVAVFI